MSLQHLVNTVLVCSKDQEEEPKTGGEGFKLEFKWVVGVRMEIAFMQVGVYIDRI